MQNVSLDACRLRDLLSYDPESGKFTWKTARNNRTPAGKLAGSPCGGYLLISIDGRRHLAHRLAWLYVHGEWPKHQIDHIDGNRSNNRITNLRDVPQWENVRNVRSAHKDSKSGYLGVTWHRKGWKAQIGVDGKQLHIGTYSTKEEAHNAYLAAKALSTMLRRLANA